MLWGVEGLVPCALLQHELIHDSDRERISRGSPLWLSWIFGMLRLRHMMRGLRELGGWFETSPQKGIHFT